MCICGVAQTHIFHLRGDWLYSLNDIPFISTHSGTSNAEQSRYIVRFVACALFDYRDNHFTSCVSITRRNKRCWEMLWGNTLPSFFHFYSPISSLTLFSPSPLPLLSAFLSPLDFSLRQTLAAHNYATHASSLFLFWITALLLVCVVSLLLAFNSEGRWESKELPGAQFAQCFDVIEMLRRQTQTHTRSCYIQHASPQLSINMHVLYSADQIRLVTAAPHWRYNQCSTVSTFLLVLKWYPSGVVWSSSWCTKCCSWDSR